MKNRFTTALSLVLAIVILLGATLPMAGCAVTVKAEELSANYTRQASEEGYVTDAFITAMADFSMRITIGSRCKPRSQSAVPTEREMRYISPKVSPSARKRVILSEHMVMQCL